MAGEMPLSIAERPDDFQILNTEWGVIQFPRSNTTLLHVEERDIVIDSIAYSAFSNTVASGEISFRKAPSGESLALAPEVGLLAPAGEGNRRITFVDLNLDEIVIPAGYRLGIVTSGDISNSLGTMFQIRFRSRRA